MECDRLIKLVKSWYLQVQDEALAPARMVSLMKQHVADCRVCQNDPGIRQEVDKITEIILPASKVRVLGPKTEVEVPDREPAEREPEEEEEVEIRDDEEEGLEVEEGLEPEEEEDEI